MFAFVESKINVGAWDFALFPKFRCPISEFRNWILNVITGLDIERISAWALHREEERGR